MGDYNPHFPYVVGQESVPITEEDLIPTPGKREAEYGIAFTVPEQTRLDLIHVFRDLGTVMYIPGETYEVNLYQLDRFLDLDQSPVKRLRIPANFAGVSGWVGYNGVSDNIGLEIMFGKRASNPLGFDTDPTNNVSPARIFFDSKRYEEFLSTKRILNISLMYKGFVLATDPTGNPIQFVHPYPFLLPLTIVQINPPWFAPASVFGPPSAHANTGTLTLATSPEAINSYTLGAASDRQGPAQIDSQILDLTDLYVKSSATSAIGDLDILRGNGTRWIEIDFRMPDISAKPGGASGTFKYPFATVYDIALQVTYCDEARVASGWSYNIRNQANKNFVSYQLSSSNIDPSSTGTSDMPILPPGQYVATFSSVSIGAWAPDISRGQPGPPVNTIRQIYDVPTHTGYELRYFNPPDQERWHDNTEGNISITQSATIPQVSFSPSGYVTTPAGDALGTSVLFPWSPAYGRKAYAAVYGGFSVRQTVEDDFIVSTTSTPQVRFWARRFSGTTVPLQVTLGSATASITPAVFDTLDELSTEHWREVTLTFSSTPDLNLQDTALVMPGTAASDEATTPDNAALDITGDIDIRVDVTTDWRPLGGESGLIGKWVLSGNQRSYLFTVLSSGALTFNWSPDGSTTLSLTSSVPVTPPPCGRLVVRVTFDVDNGAGGRTATFYTGESINGPWTLLGTPQTSATATSIFSSSAIVEVGRWNNGGGAPLNGIFHQAQIRNLIDGTVVAFPRFEDQAAGTTSFVDAPGRTWTVVSPAAISALSHLTDCTLPVLTFSAPGEAASSRWEVLGAAAPVVSSFGFDSSADSWNFLPNPYFTAPATYGGQDAYITWPGQYMPMVSGSLPDISSDLSFMLSQLSPNVSGFVLTPGTQTLTGIGQNCGVDPCAVPDQLFYHQLNWGNSFLGLGSVRDTFDRTSVASWDSPTYGSYSYTDTGSGGAVSVSGGYGYLAANGTAASDRTVTIQYSPLASGGVESTLTITNLSPIITGSDAVNIIVGLDVASTSDFYYAIITLNANFTTDVKLYRRIGSDAMLFPLGTVTYSSLAGQAYGAPAAIHAGYGSAAKIRFVYDSGFLKFKMWPVSSDEPPMWTLQVQSSLYRGLALPGSSGSYMSTPDTAALDIAGDIDIRAEIAPSNYRTGSPYNTIVSKWNTSGNQRSYMLYLGTDGLLNLFWSNNGTTQLSATSTLPIPATDTGIIAVRATLDVNNGAAGKTVTFYTATAINSPWTQLGAAVTTGTTTSIFNSTSALIAGGHDAGTVGMFSGVIRAIEIRNGLPTAPGTIVTNPNFFSQANNATTFADDTSKTWTVAGQALIKTAEIGGNSFLLGTNHTGNYVAKIAASDLAITPPQWWFGYFELQRMDTVEPTWKTIMKATNPGVISFRDYEARPGILSQYRIRSANALEFLGNWSTAVSGTLTDPGVGYAASCPSIAAAGHILMLTTNEVQDGSSNLAYDSVWLDEQVEEDFTFPEAGFVQMQAMHNRDFYTAFRPLERGGEQFTRTVLVQAAAIAPETLADFTALRDLAWDSINYVCVRDEDGNRWLATVTVPSGNVIRNRRLYLAPINVTEVTDTPTPVDPSPWP